MPPAGCPSLRTGTRSDYGISPSRWEQAGRTDSGEQKRQSAHQTGAGADAHESDALIAARPDMQGRHLFFFAEGGTTGDCRFRHVFFRSALASCRIVVRLRTESPVSDTLGEGVDVILAPMSSSAYLREIRRRLGPALVAYTSDPESRLALDEARGLWRRDCIGAGAEDCPETRAATISVLTSFVSGSESAEDMRDRAATMIMALMDDGKNRQD